MMIPSLCHVGILTAAIGFAERNHYYEAPEPYDFLHDVCMDCNPQVELSPDPLVATTWSRETNSSKLQIYRVNRPVKYWVTPPEAAHADMDGDVSSFSLLVYENCTITLDWGVERAAWFELISRDLDNNGTQKMRVQASISEYNEPFPDKTRELVKYGQHTYRLETNDELYEGVRFSFLHFEFFEPAENPVEIAALSLVAKIKPINYTGAFTSSDQELTRAWYTGAYGVRLNMEETNLNSILMERGDRVAIQGDGHPTIDAALVAFSPYEFIRNVVLRTDSGHKHVVDDNIMAYPLYWCLSAMNYFMESGDLSTFQQTLAPDIMIILDKRIQDFLDPNLDITWFGWDDRLGNGWCFHAKNDRCTREALLAFAGLLVRVCKDFARALQVAYMPLAYQKYSNTYSTLKTNLRRVPGWPGAFGVHAAANAINAGAATRSDIELWMNTTLNDSVTICSFSQFNQYWILQGLGNADRMEHALGSIKLCWGPMMKLGKGCFWEISSPEWLSFIKDGDQAPHLPSYCHPWASGVTSWLSHTVGGIMPLLPGYQKFVATPYVSIRYPSVSATITTPQGKITVNGNLKEEDSNTLVLRVVVVCNVPGYIGIRRTIVDGNDEVVGYLDSTSLNGLLAKMISYDDDSVELIDTTSDRLKKYDFVKVEAEGVHEMTATYYRSRPDRATRARHEINQIKGIPPFPEPRYQANISSLDRQTKGDGIFVHGRDGYVLLGIDNGDDFERLPAYVANVTIRRHGFPGWLVPEREFIGTSYNNTVFLPIRASNARGAGRTYNTANRSLGMVGLDDAGGGDINCIFVDITTNQTAPSKNIFSVSVYFVAKSKSNRHAISVMDGDTLNLIAPTTLLEDFEGGVWWTVHYNNSLRLKLMDVKGIHLSAVGFSNAVWHPRSSKGM